MNNKLLYFGLGALFGAAGGSIATYFIVKEKIAAEAADEIEAYANNNASCAVSAAAYREFLRH